MRFPKLILYVGADLSPYSVEFDGNEEPLDYDNRRIKVTEEGIIGFYLLIGHTLLKRIKKDDALLPPEADKFTKPLWEMNRDKFDESSPVPWLHMVFNGRNPNIEGFIRSRTVKGRGIPEISDSLPIEIRYHECVENCNKRTLNDKELSRFYFLFLPEEFHRIRISFEVIRGRGDVAGDALTFNNYGTKGFLSYLDQVSFEITTNFPTKFLVFWINTKKEVQKLYPDLEEHAPGFRDSVDLLVSGGRVLKIPTDGKKLPVGVKGEGTEVCIVLLNSGKFADVADIETRITRFVADEFFTISRETACQDFQCYKLGKRKQEFSPITAEFGLGEKIGNEDWMAELSANLGGFAEKVCYMKIPHRNCI